GHRQGRTGLGPQGSRPQTRLVDRRAGSTGRHRPGHRQPRRLRRVPWSGQHHELGVRTARRDGRAGRSRRLPGGATMMTARRSFRHLLDRLPAVRGRYTADAPLAPVTWFRVGGPAEVLFRPADAEDLAAFMAARPKDVPVTV